MEPRIGVEPRIAQRGRERLVDFDARLQVLTLAREEMAQRLEQLAEPHRPPAPRAILVRWSERILRAFSNRSNACRLCVAKVAGHRRAAQGRLPHVGFGELRRREVDALRRQGARPSGAALGCVWEARNP